MGAIDLVKERIFEMKLIASDLDGTLLNENSKVSEANVRAIQKALDKGIKFVVVTGRSYDAAIMPIKEVGLTCPIITLNGASSFDIDGNVLRDIPMDKVVCKKVYTACHNGKMYTEFFTNKGLFSFGRDRFIDRMTRWWKTVQPELTDEEINQKIEYRFQNESVQFVEDYDQLEAIDDLKIYKLLSFAEDEDSHEKVFNELKDEGGVVITSSGYLNLEFNHPEAKKGLALKELANSMGIEMKDVMSLGDNLNDKSMLEMAGRGVAMGNADEEILNLCTFHTKTNEEDGVAYAIEEMLKEYY
ncbi:Cof-type HAD-IIB family hydrolase [Bacillus timonensis]|uniref:Cof-type HAD-IIB family hydrolase n=1 Tax=Bacillus timonensis TaxID=1033734 RepID=UPI000288853C|nr:Cof-type HAD-IIB family hydrolase [Bacillus timonensis]